MNTNVSAASGADWTIEDGFQVLVALNRGQTTEEIVAMFPQYTNRTVERIVNLARGVIADSDARLQPKLHLQDPGAGSATQTVGSNRVPREANLPTPSNRAHDPHKNRPRIAYNFSTDTQAAEPVEDFRLSDFVHLDGPGPVEYTEEQLDDEFLADDIFYINIGTDEPFPTHPYGMRLPRVTPVERPVPRWPDAWTTQQSQTSAFEREVFNGARIALEDGLRRLRAQEDRSRFEDGLRMLRTREDRSRFERMLRTREDRRQIRY